jgi:hypothetical protein
MSNLTVSLETLLLKGMNSSEMTFSIALYDVPRLMQLQLD